MKCPNCKSDVRPNAKFCRACGKMIREIRIGNYRVLDRWHNRASIFWVAPVKPLPNIAEARYLALQLNRPLSNNVLKPMCALAGPYLVPVLGQAPDEQKRWYLIVNPIDGAPLDTLKGKLDAPRATKVFEKILKSMIYLHDQGWVVARRQRRRDDDLLSQIAGWFGRGEDASEMPPAEYDPAQRFRQAFAIDANDSPVMFDFSIWEPAPAVRAEREIRVQRDMYFAVSLLYWLMTGGRLTKDLEIKLRQAPDRFSQLFINFLQEAYPTFRELGESFSQVIHAPDPGKTLPSPTTTRAATRQLTITKLTSAAMTDKGITREHNEDNYLAQPQGAAEGIFVIADGMGGQAAGEVASKMAIEEIYKSAVGQWAAVKNTSAPDDVRRMFAEWIKNANTRIFAQARSLGNDMGTTVTGALVVNGMVYVANVGDSRTYLFREGRLHPLTRDHSLVASLVQAGILKPEEAYAHPQRNEIFRALGQQSDVSVDVFEPQVLGNEDRLVLCSDGLWEMAREPECEEILRKNPDPPKACAALIKAANDRGGEDNITVIIVRVTFD